MQLVTSPLGWLSLNRYEIMTSCWSPDSHARPKFKDLVDTFSGLLERESDYLELSQCLCWKETTSNLPLSSSPTAALPVIQEQDATSDTENEEI